MSQYEEMREEAVSWLDEPEDHCGHVLVYWEYVDSLELSF
jgi:hypothetical protein